MQGVADNDMHAATAAATTSVVNTTTTPHRLPLTLIDNHNDDAHVASRYIVHMALKRNTSHFLRLAIPLMSELPIHPNKDHVRV